MTRGNQRDKAREKNLKEAAAQVMLSLFSYVVLFSCFGLPRAPVSNPLHVLCANRCTRPLEGGGRAGSRP